MTQLTISIPNQAKYEALLAFIAQEGDILVEKTKKNAKTSFSATAEKKVAYAKPKVDLSQFCGIIKPSQSINEIDAQLAEMRQEWERIF